MVWNKSQICREKRHEIKAKYVGENGIKQKTIWKEKWHKTKAKYEGKGKTTWNKKQIWEEGKNGMKQKPNIKGREKRHETKAKCEGKGKIAKYRVFFKKVRHKREGKMQKKLKMT